MTFRPAHFLIVSALVLCMGGCMPRGETRTLDEILLDAREQFSTTDRKGVPAELSPSIDKLAAKLQEIAAGGDSYDYVSNAHEIGDVLGQITVHAGYTSRPGFGELANQYHFFKAGASSEGTRSQGKLLVARTFSLLTSELKTTHFAL